MILPMSKRSFQDYAQYKSGGFFDGLEENFINSKLNHGIFINNYLNDISNMKNDQDLDLSDNPFSVFIFERAGLEHKLLK